MSGRLRIILPYCLVSILMVLLTSCGSTIGKVQFNEKDLPKQLGVVTDYANIFSPEEEKQLSAYIDTLIEFGFDNVMILTVPTIPSKSIELFTEWVFSSWGLGLDEKYQLLYVVALEEGQIWAKASDNLAWRFQADSVQKVVAKTIYPKYSKGLFYDGTDSGLKELTSFKYTEPPTPLGGYAAIQKNTIYPKYARANGLEGTVILQMVVSKYGFVTEVKILKGVPGSGLDSAAIDAANKTLWKPATLYGKPVKTRISVPIKFRLRPF